MNIEVRQLEFLFINIFLIENGRNKKWQLRKKSRLRQLWLR
jgi:hypothetical protein